MGVVSLFNVLSRTISSCFLLLGPEWAADEMLMPPELSPLVHMRSFRIMGEHFGTLGIPQDHTGGFVPGPPGRRSQGFRRSLGGRKLDRCWLGENAAFL